MADWNPNEPRLLGEEWNPTIESGQPLAAAAQIGAAAFGSTSAETVLTLGAFFPSVTEQGQWLMEVYEQADAVIDAETQAIYRPNADIARVNATNQAAATTNLWQSIDESTLSLTDYVTTTVGKSASYDHELGTAAWPAARRVKDVVVTFVGRQIVGSHRWQLLVADATVGFFTYFSQVIPTASGLFTASVSLGESNPFTGLPWWQGDITDFDSTQKYLRWRWTDPSDALAEARLYQVYVTVIYATENRQCVASMKPPEPGWTTSSPVTPAGVSSWSKANATDYVVTMRRFRKSGAGAAGGTDVPPPSESGVAQWGYLAGAPYVPSRSSYAPTLDVRGGIEALGDPGTRGYAFMLETNAPLVSTDSQPYNALRIPIFDSIPASVQQTMTPSVDQTPTRVRLLVAADSVGGDPLLVSVSEATTINTWSGQITQAEFDAAPFADTAQNWKLMEADLTVTAGTGTITAPNQVTVSLGLVYVTVGPPQTVADWRVGFLETVNFTGATVAVDAMFTTPGGATFGGTTDQITADYANDEYPLLVVRANADLCAQLIEPPTAPANPASSPAIIVVPGDGSACAANSVNGAQLTWDATALGADFGSYEIGRDEGPGVDVMLRQLDEAQEVAYDFTALRGVAADYTVRVVDALGIASEWAVLGQVTAAAVGCELIFVSNERLDIAVTGSDEPVRDYEFLTAAGTTFMQVEGRDYQLEIKATEWRGDRFTREVMLWGPSNGSAPPGGSGRVVFDRILELAAADVAYVAVLDSDGRRWLAAIQVPRARRSMPEQQHKATVEVTEITADPLVELPGAQVTP